MKTTLYIGGLLGLALLIGLALRADLGGMLHALALGGPAICWLAPYRLLFFLLYAWAWHVLLQPYDPRRRLTLVYLTWVATIREAIDRLLPVASVGGAVAGVRLLRWRNVPVAQAAASVLVEVLLTLLALWVFAVAGLALLGLASAVRIPEGAAWFISAGGLALPLLLGALLRYGRVFSRLERALARFTGLSLVTRAVAGLDEEVRATLRRKARLLSSGALQFAAMICAAFEIWFALRVFGHPVSPWAALAMESLMQLARHLAFLVPAALGVQELSLIAVGGAFGVSTELALAVSLVKRLREVVWGVPALISWQIAEARRLRSLARQVS